MPKPSHRKYADYEAVAKELCKYMPGYEKTKKYFQRIRLYEFLSQHGDLEKALNLAKRSVELHDEGAEISYSQMYQLFEKLEQLDPKSKK